MTLQSELQRLSGTTLDAAGAANVLAGTTGLELVGALNVWAGTSGRGLNAAVRAKAGTGLGEADKVLADMAGTPSTTTYTLYPSTQGGYILSSNVTYSTARSGGSRSVITNFLYIGQESGYNLREAFLVFDTSSVVGTITSATLSLYGGFDGSTVDFLVEARLRDWGTTIETSDWVPGANLAGLPLLATHDTASGWPLDSYTTLVSESAFPSSINQAGNTGILLTSSRLTAGSVPPSSTTEFVGAHPGEDPNPDKRPKLVIEAT